MQRILWIVLLGVLLRPRDALATNEPQDQPASRPATQPSALWHTDTRYVWETPASLEVYRELFKRVPPEQAAAVPFKPWGWMSPEEAAKLPQVFWECMPPIDCSDGTDHPKLSYLRDAATDETIIHCIRFPGIDYLDLYYAKLSPESMMRICDSTARSLSLPRAGLSNQILQELLSKPGSLPRLQHLEIEPGKSLTADVLDVVGRRQPELRSLQLCGPAVTDDWAKKLAGMKALRGIRFYNASITDQGLKALGQADTLTHLAITYCRHLTADRLKALCGLSHLKELHLIGPTNWSDSRRITTKDDQTVTDDALAVIAEHPSIEVLFIESSSVSERGIQALSRMKNLRVLVVMRLWDNDVRTAVEDWAKADSKRRWLKADPNLSGWVEDLEGSWVRLRAYYD